MDTHKFMAYVKSSLALKDIKNENKKESLKKLLKKLNTRKISIIKSVESSSEKKEFQEDLDIISLQIKKGEKLLHDLSSYK